MNRQCLVARLGMIDYGEALDLQWGLARSRMAGDISDLLILLEHPPTITLGLGGSRENLLLDKGSLEKQGVAFYEVERGGDVTYHGPGQLVGYPILDLRDHGQDIHVYLRKLEEVIILSLTRFGIRSGRREGLTGVWLEDKKIASIGIHVGRWVSWHGFALNVNTDLSYFDLIVPCGIKGVKMTSMANLLGREVPIEEVENLIVTNFGIVFEAAMREVSLRDVLIA
ncbi:MAG: lipoyl(octanoyl) transferase LipB [candidate division NC10 bacterium]|nr:lipoyl(octanoyl) transferase LipB [candidate division NC10 bacterium]